MSATTSCEIIRPLLSAYIDEEATAAEAERVKSHLAHCARCASELAFLRLSHEALSHPGVAAVPPSLHERIAMATYARPTLQSRIAAWLRPAPARLALGGAAMATVLAVAFVLRTPDVSKQPAGSGQVANNQSEAPQPPPNPSEPVPALPPVTNRFSGRQTDVTVNTTRPKRNAAPPAPTGKKPSPAQIAITEAPPRPLSPAKAAETVRPQVARNEAREPVKMPKSSLQRPLIIAKVTPAPAPPAAAPRRVDKTITRRQPVKDTTPFAPEPKRRETVVDSTPEPMVVAAAPPSAPEPSASMTDAEPERGGLTADGRIRRRVDKSTMTGVIPVAANGSDSIARRRSFEVPRAESFGHSPGVDVSFNRLPASM